MRVLGVGASGEFGRLVARTLASRSSVSEIVIAGRNPGAVESCAKEVGEKAEAVSLDISDRDKLVTLAKDCDIVVNTAAPEHEVTLKVLEAAIEAGTNYCDIGGDGPTTGKALELDSSAKAKGVTALLGIGACPGLCTLIMLHAARQLDRVEEVRSCVLVPATAFGITKEVVSTYRETKHVSGGWRAFMRWYIPPFQDYRGGRLTTIKDETDEVMVTTPGNGEIPAMLIGTPEAITLPRYIQEIQGVHTLFSWFPFQLNRVCQELGRRVAKGEIDESEATLAFLDQNLSMQDQAQPAPVGVPMATRWAEAVGTKNGRRTKYMCWPVGWFRPNPTPVVLTLAATKILNGEIRSRGVITPESCLDPLPFFKEVAREQLKTDEPGKLLNESWQTLD